MEGSTLGSSITIGNGVSIRPGSTIESYVVLGDCVMVAEFATIGAGSIVGNCASVAAGTKLPSNSHVSLNASCDCQLTNINWGGVGIPGEPVMGPELPSILEDA